MFKDNQNANQIMRIDSKSSFVEVINSSFTIRKVQLNFFEYNKNQNNKITKKISVYIDIEKFLELSHDLQSGNFVNMFIKAKQTGVFNGEAINQYTSYFIDQGGSIKNNNVISRIFKIQEGRRPGTWNLYASEGPGKQVGAGFIQPKGRPTSFINIPIPHKQLITLVKKVEMHLQAFTTMVYVHYGNRLYYPLLEDKTDETKGFTTYFYKNKDNDNKYNNNINNNNMQNQQYNQYSNTNQQYNNQQYNQQNLNAFQGQNYPQQY